MLPTGERGTISIYRQACHHFQLGDQVHIKVFRGARLSASWEGTLRGTANHLLPLKQENPLDLHKPHQNTARSSSSGQRGENFKRP